MLIETKDYGYKAYLIFKYDGHNVDNGVIVKEELDTLNLIKEYYNSDFSTYNNILKQIIKGKSSSKRV